MPEADLPILSAIEFLRWIVGRRRRFRVTGASMFPLLKPGDEVLLDRRAYHSAAPSPGDIVVAEHPSHRGLLIIKRLVAVHPDGSLNLKGENPFESTDFHALPPGKIIGRVSCVFSRAQPPDAASGDRG